MFVLNNAVSSEIIFTNYFEKLKMNKFISNKSGCLMGQGRREKERKGGKMVDKNVSHNKNNKKYFISN